jgi:hypothetical protein
VVLASDRSAETFSNTSRAFADISIYEANNANQHSLQLSGEFYPYSFAVAMASGHFEYLRGVPGRVLVYEPTDKELKHWRRTHWATRSKYNSRDGRLEPLCACVVCQRWYSNRERVDWRTVWSESGEDLTTRKMRDLNSRLGLYRYGDHHWLPAVMARMTARRLYDAFLGSFFCGCLRPAFWPAQESHTNHREEKVGESTTARWLL